MSIQVEVYGRKIVINSTEPERLKECEAFLKNYMDSIVANVGQVDGSKMFLLACLQLSDDLLTKTEEFDVLKAEMSEAENLLDKYI